MVVYCLGDPLIKYFGSLRVLTYLAVNLLAKHSPGSRELVFVWCLVLSSHHPYVVILCPAFCLSKVCHLKI